MTRPVLNASRIELRPMTLQHLPFLHGLDSDPVVMEFLLGRARTSNEIDDFWAPRCAERIADEAGLGWWVGFENDDFLGWWDLGRSSSAPDVPVNFDEAEIGWRLMRRCWGGAWPRRVRCSFSTTDSERLNCSASGLRRWQSTLRHEE